MDRRGFTLIEVMMVVIIMGLITALAYPQYQAVSHSNLRLSSRQLAGSIRYLYARAILDKKSWRLAVDFENNKYWGERLENPEDIEGADQEKEKGLPDESWANQETSTTDVYSLNPTEEQVEETAPQWVKTSTPVLKTTALPSGVVFRDMRALGRDEVNNGIGYIYFNPYGGVERAVIHLKHEKHDWIYSLVTKPLSGRVAVFDKDYDIEHAPITGQVR